ncbi:hypothetical protein CBM2595_A80202 [Cupriavidus taiwanensis]|nr:hypothetical protein CBM2595_A80202 [Cupriavidus taiwanensis]
MAVVDAQVDRGDRDHDPAGDQGRPRQLLKQKKRKRPPGPNAVQVTTVVPAQAGSQ